MKFLSDILARAGLVVDGTVTLNSVANATTDTDRFIVVDSGIVKYRTGSELLSDIAALSAASVSGTVNYLAKFTGSSAIGNSLLFDNGTNVGVNTASPGHRLDVNGTGRFVNRLTVDADIYFTNYATTGIVITGPNVVYPLIVVGSQNTTSGNTNIIIGQGNQGTGAAYILGASNIANSNGAVTIGQGNQANSSGQFTVLIGGNNTTSHGVSTFTGTFAIGNANVLAHQASAIMGSNQTTTASNQLIIAATQSNVNTAGFNDIYFGTGPRSKNSNLLGSNITINGSGAGAGTDLSGGNVTIAGGKGTGAGAAGDVIISTAVVGGSGSALQSLAERARFNASGLTLAVISAATTDTDRFLVSDGGVIKFRTGAELLSDIGAQAAGSFVPTSRTLTINGTTFDLSADRSWSITAGVSSVSAGSGISVSSTTGAVTVTNTGILSASAGSGISVSTSGGTLTVSNTGLLSAVAGSGISVSTSGGTVTVSNTGVLSTLAGSGISVSTSGGTVTVSNTGLLSALAGSGISVSTSGGTVTVSNTGVLSILAGSGISVSTSGGTVTVSNTVTQYTDGLARAAISLTTSGTSGAATYNSTTGVLNIPQYQAVLTNPVTGTGTSGQVAYFNGTTTITSESNLFWDATNDRLGIGTQSPIANLHIVNNTNVGLRLQATAGNGSAELDLLSNGTQSSFIDYGPNQLRFRSTNADMSVINNGSVLVLQNDGSVGVGTTAVTSGYRMEVTGDILLSAAGGNRSIVLTTSNANAALNTIAGSGLELASDGTNRNLAFRTGTTTAMFINSSANVLIGSTTDNGNRLRVNGTGWFDGGLRVGAASGANANLTVRGTGTGSSTFSFEAANSSGNTRFLVRDDGESTFYNSSNGVAMRVTPGSNVLVGTTTDSGHKVNIVGGVSSQLRVEGGEADIWLVNTGGGAGTWRILGSAGNTTKVFRIYDQDAGADRINVKVGGQIQFNAYTSSSAFTGTAVATLAVDSSGNVITVSGSGGSQWTTSGSNIFYNTGNVGIGTNSPSAKLHVFDSATAATILVRGIDANLASSYMLQHGGGGARTEFDGTWYMSYGSAETNFGLTPNLGGGLVFWFNSGATTVNPMTLKRSGNVVFSSSVGIGTSSPAQRLDVRGYIVSDSQSNGSESAFYLGNSSHGLSRANLQNDIVLYTTAGDVRLSGSTASTTHLIVKNSGNVGINNTNPGARLHVESSTLQFRLSGNSNDFYVYAWGGGVNVYSTEHMYFGRDAGTDNKFYFQSRTASSTSLFVNTATERVGIFTTTPQERLDVRGNILLKGDATDGGVLSITRRYSIGPQTINFNNNHPTTNGDWTGARITSADAGNYNGYLDLAVSLGSNANEAAGTSAVASVMRLTHNRRVGVGGNTSPDTVLTVQGTGSASGHTTTDMNNIVHLTRNSHSYILFSSPDNFDQGLHFANTTDNGIVGRIAYFHRAAGDSLNFSVNSAIRMTLDASGGLTITGTLTEQSAARYKENIAPVTAALDKVDQLQPVSYNKKGFTTKEIGLIAEDVFDVFPEFVLCDDNGEPVGIHYSRLTAVLIESVKELKKEINELKNRN